MVSLPEDHQNAVTTRRILNILQFEDMHERFNDVDTAYEGTFTWALDDEMSLESMHRLENLPIGSLDLAEPETREPVDTRKVLPAVSSPLDTANFETKRRSLESLCGPFTPDRRCRNKFTAWLQSGTGLFHIVGKPGSGKSTFMKALYNHPRTTQFLQKWAAGAKLVVAKFFFSRDGSKKQKTTQGMCRALLHDILDQCPELTPEALPEVWKAVASCPWQVEVKVQLTMDNVREALRRLLQIRGTNPTYRFGIFIDGIDENEETSFDCLVMLDLLSSWLDSGRNDVKICSASRPFGGFLKVFSESQRLWLHNHTLSDLRKLVYDRLQVPYSTHDTQGPVVFQPSSSASGHSIFTIAEDIIQRADGDFRWACLAVKSVLHHGSTQIPGSQRVHTLFEGNNHKAFQLDERLSCISLTDILDQGGISAWPTMTDSMQSRRVSASSPYSPRCLGKNTYYERTPHLDTDLRKDQIKELERYLGVSERLEDELFAVEDARAEGTCKWLSAQLSYQSWRDPDSNASRVLWITGKPASGKSTLAGYVINELQTANAHCSFFFFKYGNNSKSNLSACLKALAFQMARKSASIGQKLLEIKENNDLNSNLDNTTMLWRTLFLDGIFGTNFERQYWVIDAVDECENYAAAFQSMLGNFDESIPLRILITSRETPALQAEVSNLSPRLVQEEKISPADTLCDIKLLVEAKAKAFVALEEESKNALVDKVLTKSRGSFLWTVLVLKELSNAHSEEEVNRVLEEVPRGMEPLYHRTLGLMSHLGRGKKLAKAILTWTTCATRPLTLKELDELLKLEMKESFPKLEASIVALCGQLVIIDKSGNVQMIHETAREFLLKDDLRSEFAVDPVNAHTQIAKVCLEYLAGDGMRIPRLNTLGSSNSAIRKRTAFSSYACSNFSYHLAKADPRSDDLPTLLDKFLKANILSWIEFISSTASLSPLVQTSKNLRVYLKACEAYRPPLETAEIWTTDLIRISAKFADALIAFPAAIFTLIPPFCPINSAIYGIRTPGRGLSVLGIPTLKWDDRLSCIDFHAQTRSVCYGDKFLAVGLATGVVALYSALTGQEYKVLQHNEPVNLLTFVNDKESVASYGTKTIKIWNVSSGEPIHDFQVPQRCVSLQYDNGCLIAACDKNYLASWDLRNHGLRLPDRPWHAGIESEDSQLRGSPSAISISNGHKMLAVAYSGRPILLWDLEEDMYYGTCGRKLPSGKTNRHLVTALVFNPNPAISLLVASYLDGELGLFDPFKDICLKYFRANCPKLAASPDGRLLAGAAGSGSINVYEFETLKLMYRINSSNLYVKQLAFSSNSLHLVDIRGSQCNVWEPAILHQESVDGHIGVESSSSPCGDAGASETKFNISAMVLLTRESCVLCGGNDGSVSLYDLRNGTLLKTLYWHRSAVRILTWWSKSNTVMSIDASNSIMAWKATQLEREGLILGQKLFQCRLECEKTITQMLPGEAAHRFILSTRESDHLWSAEGREECSRACYDRPGVRKWIQHPQSPFHVLCIEGCAVRILTWSDWSEVSCVPFSIDEANLQLKSITACTFDCKPSILFELSELDGGSDTRGLRLLRVDSLGTGAPAHERSASSTPHAQTTEASVSRSEGIFNFRTAGLVQDTKLKRISSRISHIVGFSDAGKMIFLDKYSWVCSLALEQLRHDTVLYLRHFFVPCDWFAGKRNIVCAVSGRNVLFARNDRVAIVEGGLDFSESVTLLAETKS